MPALIEYLVKLSVSLGVVWLFYQFVLRRLTFYNHNRWYLLGYTVLSFFIPLINISNAIKKDQVTTNTILQWVPAFNSHSVQEEKNITGWNIISLVILIGIAVMLVRLMVQLISFKRMTKRAALISNDGINIYQVDESIIPFSFGNAVFINKKLHTEEELEEIIRHEFVHVQQRHSVDIILSELLCLFNWYNPFAWMLRSSIRQNLEFVADNKVLQNGINKKQYQYLLLKVIGNDQFSIAQKFNFSSLKKRIAMMNKNKSTKMHLLRFLFLLPVLALILVSFRKEIGDTLTGKNKPLPFNEHSMYVRDTIPAVTVPNDKGYMIDVIDRSGNCTLVIKDKNGKQVKRLLLTEWNANAEKYEALYGEIPPPPPPTPLYLATTVGREDFLNRNTDVKEIGWVFHYDNTVASIELTKKNGSIEIYNLDKEADKSQFEKKYGSIPYPPPPPAPPTPPATVEIVEVPQPPVPPTPPAPVKLPPNVQKLRISDNDVTVTLKNGEKENYDLSKPDQKSNFQKKYGDVLVAPPLPPVKEIDANGTTITMQQVEAAPAKLIAIKRQPNATIMTQETNAAPVKAISGNPLIILDGTVITKVEMQAVNPDNIQAVDVLKGEKAIAAYGSKGEEGVIVITSKGNNDAKSEINIRAAELRTSADSNDEINITSSQIEFNNVKGLVMLDGKEYTAGKGKLSGNYNIVTLKKEEAMKKYGDKGKNGATEITTLK